ncbi:MAG TPA: endonuclease/exonuclease/phosphatase family protein [Parachlamydiaceae bacterium]|nr:endonuclease/exonuclease/phosphatase family protein [Parachlamydiaceae bacterium]
MNKFTTKITFSLLILTAFYADAVENSVIPTMESYECIDNLPSQKFTKNQFNEISNALARKDEMIRLVTYNMLFNLYDHNLDEENRWPNRLPRIVELVREMKPDIIATQELYPAQVQDIINLIGDDFSIFNGMRDENGESYGIFYRTDRFELLSSQFTNPLCMVQLKDLKTDKTIHIANTHMPFSNIEMREANAHKICEILEPFAEQTAVIFAGDLNIFPGRLELKGLPFYDGDYIHRILSKGVLKNSREQSLIGHFGPISTFTNNESTSSKAFQGTGVPGIFLDYIYVSDKVTVLTHAVEPGTVDGHFPSDHMPVLIDFLIN